ncbi:SWI/SNF-related matrix-associated actin-dependent regulator of chromatin subfamily A-like protein 1 [Nasonia vitripennis]|uniref:SWI/SNF-related matrix-associated actin-dependent regulator of chromatin subfamily A-like protein 1 n=1 Tax=Nasonia vitripennis TaxID=7425 RepID=A0A7M7Q1D5_NASVI|nr:SWI/SNF-related matrix-associated actin-dependent regulator of chromatin subfamily A-like protein 1 [Nasonia vitripennis]XP_031779097.1 SWI/SNF-related matrix-associated actin-dependent regulator of chromatin subfamily A-like protein 1 [Nasonia vitripennis]
MYSKEEIERKRQQALERKKQNAPVPNNSPSTGSTNGFMSNFTNKNSISYTSTAANQNVAPNLSNKKPYGYSQNKSQSTIKQQSSANRYNPISSTTTRFYGNVERCELTCSMISSNRFVVEMSKYNEALVNNLFKTIPSRLYDIKTKLWSFNINEYDMFHEKLIGLKCAEITFKGLPSFLLTTFKNLLKQENQPKPVIDTSIIDDTLMNSLYPFQKEGIEYGISKNGKCLIADDMGLGKTRQALGIAHYYRSDWPLLIVTPSSVRYQWSEAVIENLDSVPLHAIQHLSSTKDYIESSQITILSYDLLTRRIDEIAARKYGVILCDESHYLKSGKTQRTKAVQRLATHAKRIILLTGTPALSRPIELFPQIKLLMPNFMSYQDFGMRYCSGVQTNYGWDFNGSSNLKELEILLKACCLIRRLKSDVMTQLPSKIRQKIILDPHMIKAATKEMEAASKEMQKKSLTGAQKHGALLQYYSESSKAKEKAVCNYVTDLIENQQKFLIFAHHKNMMDAISNLLTSKKVLFIRIDGKTHPEQRKQFVDTFQQNENVLVAVLSITAANAGITLTAAQLVVFAELSWNPGILCQAEDRVHRIGQTDNVVIRYLLAKDTADDYLWPKIQKKIDVLNEVGLDQNFDLDKADVTNQLPDMTNQKSLDDFVECSGSNTESSLNTSQVDASGNAELQTSSESLRDLLDLDDDAFNDIDLDNLA